MLEVSNVRGGYGDADVLCDVSVSVGEAEIVAVAGTNGSGKSTLGRAVMGLLPRWSGSIRCRGVDLRRYAVSDRIGLGIFFVPQVANVFPSLTVGENLAVVKTRADPARLRAALDLFPALESRLRMRASTLSGGERQQLAIARGVVAGARLMILDEPTANLAPRIIKQVLELIRGLPEFGVSVLLIEQRAREAFGISDRGYVMHVGEVVAEGASEKLLVDEHLGKMFFGLESMVTTNRED